MKNCMLIALVAGALVVSAAATAQDSCTAIAVDSQNREYLGTGSTVGEAIHYAMQECNMEAEEDNALPCNIKGLLCVYNGN